MAVPYHETLKSLDAELNGEILKVDEWTVRD